jgi:hypothetical protein
MITLNKNYYITSDSNNWMLNYAEEKTKDNGEKYTAKDTWYYSKLSDLLSRFLDQQLKDTTTAEGIMSRIEQTEQIIKKLDLKK